MSIQHLTLFTENEPPCPTSNMSACGLASGHKYTMSTPTKPSPLRTEITQEMADLELEEGEKTPTQESYARESTP